MTVYICVCVFLYTRAYSYNVHAYMSIYTTDTFI